MLINFKPTPRDPRDTILEAMSNTSFRFHLTGSRFFGNAHEKSDYDFFVGLDEPNIVDWLISQHFLQDKSTKYKDSNTALVYQHASGVHVQVVNNVDLKSRIQDAIKSTGVYKGMTFDKQSRKTLWNLCYKVATLKQHTN